MEVFDQYLFDDVVAEYNRDNLSSEDYEEIYQRFLNLNYLVEVQPYLYSMRYLGLGTVAEPEKVISELSNRLDDDNVSLCGLYYDLLLFKNQEDNDMLEMLKTFEVRGYSNHYLKDKSHLNKERCSDSFQKKPANKQDIENNPQKANENKKMINRSVEFVKMEFQSNGYKGLYFTSWDIDYLSAKIYVTPVDTTRKISVRSQLYIDDYHGAHNDYCNDLDNRNHTPVFVPYSKVFSDEIILQPGENSFVTTGWGNKKGNTYEQRKYKWVIEIDGKKTYSQQFFVYFGTLTKEKVRINGIKLTMLDNHSDESKINNLLSKIQVKAVNISNLGKTNPVFESEKLSKINFQINYKITPQAYNGYSIQDESFIYCQFTIKLLGENSKIFDDYGVIKLNTYGTDYSFWVGNTKPGWLKKGKYYYSISFTEEFLYEGTFSVI